MSHFTVLVIGDDPETQLAPYHEFECTGYDDEYVQDIDKTEEARLEYTERKASDEDYKDKTFAEFVTDWYGLKVTTTPNANKISEAYKFGYCLVDESGNVLKVIDRTNPNKKWDWYQVGGRWAGFFKLKAKHSELVAVGTPGLMTERAKSDTADSLLKGDIDIDLMRNEAQAEAEKTWDKVHEAVKDKLQDFQTWESLREEHKSNIDEARRLYHLQPAVAAFSKVPDMGFFDKLDDYLVPRDHYVQTARNAAIVPFAFVRDGKWYDKGDMGWWGVVSNEKDQCDWNEEFNKMFDRLPSDTLVTLVDCHI